MIDHDRERVAVKNARLSNQVSASQLVCQETEQSVEQSSMVKNKGHDVRSTHNSVKQAKLRSYAKRKLTERRSGGYRTTKCLTHGEYRSAKDAASAIVNAGYGWTIFLSIRPQEDLTDRQKQDRIQKILSRYCKNRFSNPKNCFNTTAPGN